MGWGEAFKVLPWAPRVVRWLCLHGKRSADLQALYLKFLKGADGYRESGDPGDAGAALRELEFLETDAHRLHLARRLWAILPDPRDADFCEFEADWHSGGGDGPWPLYDDARARLVEALRRARILPRQRERPGLRSRRRR